MNLRTGEVDLIQMQFRQAVGIKVRPALVLLDTGDDDFVAAPITSQNRRSEFDLAIQDWRVAGLNVGSSIRIHKLTVLAKAEIVRRLGELSEHDGSLLEAILCRAFCRRSVEG